MPTKGRDWSGKVGAPPRTIVPMREVVGAFAPVPELIEELEKLLGQAKSGKLRACAWATVYHADAKPDGEVASGWARGPYTGFGLTAAIERLNYRWKKQEWEP